METLKFIKKHKDINALTKHYGIKVKEYDDRYVLNYCQIESSKHKTNPIVRECRNLILSKNFEVMHRSFDRFFNLGEYADGEIGFDITKANCFEKIDGSLIGIYFDGNKWCACTRQLAFAEGPTSVGVTFNFIIERALGGVVVDYFAKRYNFKKDYSYICEIVSSETRVVKPYSETALYILAVRNKKTGEYVEDELNRVWSIRQLRKPEVFTFGSFEECVTAMKNLPSDFDEGVVCEYNGIRIKVKSPAYLAISKLRNNGVLSIPRVVQLVFENETDEYLSIFKEDYHIFEPYMKAYDKFIIDVQYIFDLYKDFDRKKFAQTVLPLSYAGVLFKMYEGKTLIEALKSFSMDAKVRILEGMKGK